METIDIKELLNYFRAKLSIILLITMVVTMVGGVYSFFIQEPKYKSTTTVILKNDISQGTNLTYNDVTINKNLVGTYSEIVKSKKILNKAIKNLKIDYTYSQLYDMIQVASVPDTELIKISVVNESSNTAKVVANEVANVFVEEIPELYNISNVSILDTAEVATTPYNVNVKKQTAIYLMVGLVLGCGIVFLIYYFDRTIKSSEQIELKLGLPVLGSVQEYKKGSR